VPKADTTAAKIAQYVRNDPNVTIGASADGKYVEIIPMTAHRSLMRLKPAEAEIWLSGYITGHQRPRGAT
jgi:hypothetical protein